MNGGDYITTPTAEQTAERTLLVRTLDAVVAEGDGRTLDIRLVPYNTPATVADPPDWRPYREMFVPGVFERQVNVPDRVKIWLNFEHEDGLRGIVGHGVELRDRADGLEGSFRVHENADGDKALQLVRDELLTGASVEYFALRSRSVNGIMQRIRGHIDKVALVRSAAYATAGVLAIREEPLEIETPPATPAAPVLSGEVTERLAALGYEPLERAATTSKAWDGSPGRFTDDQYRRAALFCRGTGSPPKTDCSLPVLEPDGTLNVNALGAAAAALAGARGGVANASASMKAGAARKLIRYYRRAGMEPPASLVALARS